VSGHQASLESVSRDPSVQAEVEGEGLQRELYSEGLETLRQELERKYKLENVLQLSYAIAADINCLDGSSGTHAPGGHQEDKEALCLLADRSRIAAAYGSTRDTTFYPLAFHPRYGNFSSKKPPGFLDDLLTVIRDNMSVQNDGRDVVSFGSSQGYSSGLKRAFRHRKDDLLAMKGTATAALTMSPSEVGRSPAHVRAKNERLLRELRGERTPD
jgi:hypothetical protein